MTDMMHSTTAIVMLAVFLLVVFTGLLVAVRLVGQRAKAGDE